MTRSQTSPPTIRDVAARAGVSPGTVSKALNGNGQLRDSTRSRVTAAAEELGFRPNHLAKSLLEGRTYTVGILTSDSFGRFTTPVMVGIEDTLGAGRMSTLLCDGRGDPLRERHYVQELLNRRVDGLVVTGRRPDPRPSLGRLPIPVVYVLVRSDDPEDLSITYDDVQGAELGVNHLVANGRKRFAYVSGPARHWSTPRRRDGVQRGLTGAGLTLDPNLVLLGEWSEAWGRTAAGQLLRQDPGLDAVVCGSDQIARGLVDGFREAGVGVPADVAVVGFDNWDVMVEASRPPLTTVDPNLKTLGRLAATRLMDAIDGHDLPRGVRHEPCDLVLRQSSG